LVLTKLDQYPLAKPVRIAFSRLGKDNLARDEGLNLVVQVRKLPTIEQKRELCSKTILTR